MESLIGIIAIVLVGEISSSVYENHSGVARNRPHSIQRRRLHDQLVHTLHESEGRLLEAEIQLHAARVKVAAFHARHQILRNAVAVERQLSAYWKELTDGR